MLDHVVAGFYRDSHQIILFMSPQEKYQINELSACSKIHKTIIFFLHTTWTDSRENESLSCDV